MNAVETDHIFARVASILEQAQGEVVRSVNQATVVAYWSIGREIVEALQGGDARAEYGKALVENLSERLTARFGKGFSMPNLWAFRQFYMAYAERISYTLCSQFENSDGILYPVGRELETSTQVILYPLGRESSPPFPS
jgi:hypothetical protein